MVKYYITANQLLAFLLRGKIKINQNWKYFSFGFRKNTNTSKIFIY